MAALLVAMTMMAIAMTVALPVWHTMAQREKEEELIFRGNQYVRAITLFQRRFPGATPPNIDTLINGRLLRKKYKDPITGGDFQIVGPGDAIAPPGAAGASAPGFSGRAGTSSAPGSVTGGAAGPAGGGLTSSTSPSSFGSQTPQSPSGVVGPGAAAGGILGVVSKSKATSLRLYNGRSHYNEWVFVATAQSNRAGMPGANGAPAPGRGGPGRGGLPPSPGTGAIGGFNMPPPQGR